MKKLHPLALCFSVSLPKFVNDKEMCVKHGFFLALTDLGGCKEAEINSMARIIGCLYTCLEMGQGRILIRAILRESL